jgi:uncharacterized LabA/DUF88 family protein
VSRIAIFVDAAYLDFLLRDEFNRPAIDYEKFARVLAGDRELLRVYFYDCLPYKSANPTNTEIERFSRKRRFHSALNRLPRFDVRLGKLARRVDNSVVRYEQKRVDILLAIDLVQLAAKRLITDAVLIAGDSDFLPAIEVAKQEGVVVHLYHGASPHSDLVACCDECTRIDADLISTVRMI